MNKRISIVILLVCSALFGQEVISQGDFYDSPHEIFELLYKDPKKAYQEAKRLEEEAIKNNSKENELIAINLRCMFYRVTNDFKNMMETAKLLEQKSFLYKYPQYQLIAKRHLFESFLFTGLSDMAFEQLQQGSKIFEKLDESSVEHIKEKANFLIAYSNYYLLKKDYKNQLKYTQLAGKEFEKLPEDDSIQKLLSIHYSNLASSYNKNDLRDSAKYYAKLSESKNKNFIRSELHFNNLIVLGDVAMSEHNYQEALNYFIEAEKIKEYKNHIDIEELFGNIILANEKLNRLNEVKIYQAKKDSLKLSISQNQNQTLHKLLSEKEGNQSKFYKYTLLVVGGLLVLVLGFFVRRYRTLLKQEKISDQYLENSPKNPSGDDYSKLLDLLKNNDPAFMIYFEENFPGFSSELKKITPDLSDSEIEFCALLKLKIPTKDIAKYIFRAPQTIRNKKYIIKNKLYIPKETDIYEWFDNL